MGKAWKEARNIVTSADGKKTPIKESLGDDNGDLPWGQVEAAWEDVRRHQPCP